MPAAKSREETPKEGCVDAKPRAALHQYATALHKAQVVLAEYGGQIDAWHSAVA